ncbi:hypothetical protein HOH87_04190 [bacterium]|jgi:flagellar motor switch protein FliG|nr:hypothetical protein [bacterium]
MAEKTIAKIEKNNLEKSAIILLFLEAEMPGVTANVISHLEMHVVKEVLLIISNIRQIPKDQIRSAVNEFYHNFLENDVLFGGRVASGDLLETSFDAKTRNKIVSASDGGLFDYLDRLSDEDLINFFEKESIQMITLLMNYMTQSKMARLMTKMDTKQVKTISRLLLTLEVPSLDVIWKLHFALDEYFNDNVLIETHSTDLQLDKMASVFETMSEELKSEIFKEIQNEQPQMFEELKKRILTFEDLINVSDIDFQTIMYEVQDVRTVYQSIQNTGELMAEKLNTNITERYKAMIQNEAEELGEVSDADIEIAQLKIIKAARALEKDDKIERLLTRTELEKKINDESVV